MERRARLERNTPLRADPAKAREWQDRSRKPLPPWSPERRRLRKERQNFTEMVLRHRINCEAFLPGCCTGRTAEVNELQRGPARVDCWLDWNKVTALCSECHRWITRHPEWALHHGHQLQHERELTEHDWEIAAELRHRFRLHPCRPHCDVDHRQEYE